MLSLNTTPAQLDLLARIAERHPGLAVTLYETTHATVHYGLAEVDLMIDELLGMAADEFRRHLEDAHRAEFAVKVVKRLPVGYRVEDADTDDDIVIQSEDAAVWTIVEVGQCVDRDGLVEVVRSLEEDKTVAQTIRRAQEASGRGRQYSVHWVSVRDTDGAVILDHAHPCSARFAPDHRHVFERPGGHTDVAWWADALSALDVEEASVG